MFAQLFRATVAVVALGALTTLAYGDHIPGHDDDSDVHPVPIPGQNDFNGGIAFVTAIGPVGGREIVSTDFDITWVSDGATPASDVEISVGMLLGDGMGGSFYQEMHVTGADLGFGSGPGTYSGTMSTDAFNGIALESFFFPPYSIVDLTLGATTGGVEGVGYFQDSFINFHLAPVPAPASAALLMIGGVAACRRRRC